LRQEEGRCCSRLSITPSIYTAGFATYNETYGSLGAVVVLLMWLFLTAFTVLAGAEIDAARDTRDAEHSSRTPEEPQDSR